MITMANENIVWQTIYLDGIQSDYSINNYGQIINNETKEYRIPSLANNGYYHITLYRHGKAYTLLIHRLVATYFVKNDNPSLNTYVDHKDGNKQNNCYTNLEWVTPKENTKRAIEMGLTDPRNRNQVKGSKSGVSKHTEEEAHAACKLLEQGLSNKQVSNKLNIDTEFVRSLKRGVWKHITSQYNIPKPEVRRYYSDDFRNNIRNMILLGKSDKEIAILSGLPDPDTYGSRYVNKIRSRMNLQCK